MPKIVFIGAGSGFGARSILDIMSFPELRDCELVLVDVNPSHLGPVAEFAHKVVAHYDAPTRIRTEADWRNGVLDGADYVMTSFAQGGPAYNGVPYHYEISIPAKHGIPQCVADTAGIGGVVRTMRTAPELLAIGKDMEVRCPGAYMFNYVNPMAMLTRTLSFACPKVHMVGLCHNIQYGIRDLARWLGVSHKQLRYTAAGVNHMDWFLRLEYLDGQNAYPDLLKAAEKPEVYRQRSVQFELLKEFGYWTTESARHCAEYLPYYLPRPETWEKLSITPRETKAEVDMTAPRWGEDSDLRKQLDGRKEMVYDRTFEYGMHIMHALETDAVYRMHLNTINNGSISNFPDDYCVEVRCTVDRTGIHQEQVGRLPLQLAGLCRGLADMQTLASEAVLEKDLRKALWACQLDPTTAACATPATIRQCFNEILAVEGPWLEEFWGTELSV